MTHVRDILEKRRTPVLDSPEEHSSDVSTD
jgi:hypothetical protein